MDEATDCSKAVVMLLFIYSCSHCLWGFCVYSLFCYSVLCVRQVLQSSCWGRVIWLLCLNCLPCVLFCSVALPRGSVGWSAVFDCGIS